MGVPPQGHAGALDVGANSSVWKATSIFIVGMAAIFGAIGLLSLTSVTKTTPAASADQGRDREKPAAPSTETATSTPQKDSAKQVAQSANTPSQQPAKQGVPKPLVSPTAFRIAGSCS